VGSGCPWHSVCATPPIIPELSPIRKQSSDPIYPAVARSKCCKLSRNGGRCKHLKIQEKVGSPGCTICEPLGLSSELASESKERGRGESITVRISKNGPRSRFGIDDPIPLGWFVGLTRADHFLVPLMGNVNSEPQISSRILGQIRLVQLQTAGRPERAVIKRSGTQ
jgi:hypothetical protein